MEFVCKVFNKLCDRDRECNSKFAAAKEKILKIIKRKKLILYRGKFS